MQPAAPTSWCSTCAACASAGYARCYGRTSVYSHAPPRCRTSQYRKTFIPLSVSLWNDLADPATSWWWETGGFKDQGRCIFICLSSSIHFRFLLFSLSLLPFYGWYREPGVFGLIGCQSLAPALHCRPLLMIIILIIFRISIVLQKYIIFTFQRHSGTAVQQYSLCCILHLEEFLPSRIFRC